MGLASGMTLGSYEILSALGAGGMGEVYKARDTRLQRDVAIKFLNASQTPDARAVDRFLREARAASALNHPNIVTIHEIGETEHGRYIVMELVDGRTVRELIADRPAMDAIVRIIAQVVQALTVAHAAGVVHRDIKPENIMVRADGYVKLLDFGVAHVLPTAAGAETNTTTAVTGPNIVMGTLRYMSPEQGRGERVGSASDIFSLGLVAYELAVGRHPFASETAIGTLGGILSRHAVAPLHLNPEVSPALDALILKMLEPDARLRPDAPGVVAALVDMMERRPIADGGPAGSSARRPIVGRERERSELIAAFDRAAGGSGMMVCISGEPGIGKSALLDDVIDELAKRGRPFAVGRGRCSERLAGAEAYLPVLELLEDLIRRPDGDQVAHVMKQMAPSWYSQIVPSTSPHLSGGFAPDLTATVPLERRKRELAQFLQELSRTRPLVLVVDDVHWMDLSSTDILAYVAGRFDQIRCLVVVAYRPTELVGAHHPFLSVKLDLETRGVCREVTLGGLDRAALERYVALEFPDNRFPAELTDVLHAKSEGSPLFAVELLRYLRDKKVIVADQGTWHLTDLPDIARELPDSVRSMIQRQMERLDATDRRLLVCASVHGQEFDTAIVSRAVAMDAADVEERLDVLDKVHGLVRRVEELELPDHTLTLRYRFTHVLYQNALYVSLTPARKASLSAAVAAAMLAHYGDRTGPIAVPLALLFEAVRDFERAAGYFLQAARNAARIAGYKEGVLLARRGLAMVRMMPETPARARLELNLQLGLGLALTATQGYAAPDVEVAYVRARTLAQQVDDVIGRFSVLEGLWRFYTVKPDLKVSSELAQQQLDLARSTTDDQLVALAHVSFGTPFIHRALYADAVAHIRQTLELVDPAQSPRHIALTGADLGVRAHTWLSFGLWMLGYPDQGREEIHKATARAGVTSHPFSRAFALSLAAWHHHYRREPAVVQKYAEQALAIATEHMLGQWIPVGWILRGWALVEQGQPEGLDAIRTGLDLFKTTGAELNRPHFMSMLAEALSRTGKIEESGAVLDEALAIAERNQDVCWKAELLRLKGTSLLARPDREEEAGHCFQQAIDVARAQQARLLELRATTSLSRLRQKQERLDEARAALRPIRDWFAEGFDTLDLREADALLAELPPSAAGG